MITICVKLTNISILDKHSKNILLASTTDVDANTTISKNNNIQYGGFS